ncbi:GNVR domain-containing protein [Candidatus Omnitrophota bacterium]
MDFTIAKKPLDYFKVIYRRKWLIALPLVIGLTGGILSANLLPKVYESSTLILVEEGRVINPLIQGLAVSTSVAQRLALLREQILGWDRVNQLIKKLNLAKDVKTQEDFEGLIMRLRRHIRVKLRGRNVVGISYMGPDPAEAMNIVKTITDIFISENLRQQTAETENAIGFINDQLDLYKKKLKQGEIAAMQEKLDDLMIDSTAKHPMVIDIQKKIQLSEEQMAQGNYEIDPDTLQATDGELVGLKAELKQLRGELASSTFGSDQEGANRTKLSTSTDDKLYKLLLLDRVDAVTKRDSGVNQALYNELLKRLETAKITQRLEASKDGTRYTILDPARLPLKPAKPNKIMVLFMGGFLGICAGVGFVFLAEVFDHSFLGLDEAKKYLDLPVFGAISKIVTQADIRAQRMRNIGVGFLSILTTVILVVAAIFHIFIGD